MNAALQSDGKAQFVKTDKLNSSGQYLISGISKIEQDALAEDLVLQAARSKNNKESSVNSCIVLYRPWSSSMDEGWARWLMESYGFSFTNLYNNHIRCDVLKKKYDVIILPDIRLNTTLNGNVKGATLPQYVDGAGREGVQKLDKFVRM